MNRLIRTVSYVLYYSILTGKTPSRFKAESSILLTLYVLKVGSIRLKIKHMYHHLIQPKEGQHNWDLAPSRVCQLKRE